MSFNAGAAHDHCRGTSSGLSRIPCRDTQATAAASSPTVTTRVSLRKQVISSVQSSISMLNKLKLSTKLPGRRHGRGRYVADLACTQRGPDQAGNAYGQQQRSNYQLEIVSSGIGSQPTSLEHQLNPIARPTSNPTSNSTSSPTPQLPPFWSTRLEAARAAERFDEEELFDSRNIVLERHASTMGYPPNYEQANEEPVLLPFASSHSMPAKARLKRLKKTLKHRLVKHLPRFLIEWFAQLHLTLNRLRRQGKTADASLPLKEVQEPPQPPGQALDASQLQASCMLASPERDDHDEPPGSAPMSSQEVGSSQDQEPRKQSGSREDQTRTQSRKSSSQETASSPVSGFGERRGKGLDLQVDSCKTSELKPSRHQLRQKLHLSFSSSSSGPSTSSPSDSSSSSMAGLGPSAGLSRDHLSPSHYSPTPTTTNNSTETSATTNTRYGPTSNITSATEQGLQSLNDEENDEEHEQEEAEEAEEAHIGLDYNMGQFRPKLPRSNVMDFAQLVREDLDLEDNLEQQRQELTQVASNGHSRREGDDHEDEVSVSSASTSSMASDLDEQRAGGQGDSPPRRPPRHQRRDSQLQRGQTLAEINTDRMLARDRYSDNYQRQEYFQRQMTAAPCTQPQPQPQDDLDGNIAFARAGYFDSWDNFTTTSSNSASYQLHNGGNLNERDLGGPATRRRSSAAMVPRSTTYNAGFLNESAYGGHLLDWAHHQRDAWEQHSHSMAAGDDVWGGSSSGQQPAAPIYNGGPLQRHHHRQQAYSWHARSLAQLHVQYQQQAADAQLWRLHHLDLQRAELELQQQQQRLGCPSAQAHPRHHHQLFQQEQWHRQQHTNPGQPPRLLQLARPQTPPQRPPRARDNVDATKQQQQPLNKHSRSAHLADNDPLDTHPQHPRHQHPRHQSDSHQHRQHQHQLICNQNGIQRQHIDRHQEEEEQENRRRLPPVLLINSQEVRTPLVDRVMVDQQLIMPTTRKSDLISVKPKVAAKLPPGQTRDKPEEEEESSVQELTQEPQPQRQRIVLQASTSELMKCLSDFLRIRCPKLKPHFQSAQVISWLHNADRTLLVQGWQEIAFINPANVVFLYMILRELVHEHLEDELELHCIVMTSLYLSYSYMGNEISYPLQPFLCEHDCHEKFWDRTLYIINKLSGQMLRLNADKSFFAEIFSELKNQQFASSLNEANQRSLETAIGPDQNNNNSSVNNSDIRQYIVKRPAAAEAEPKTPGNLIELNGSSQVGYELATKRRCSKSSSMRKANGGDAYETLEDGGRSAIQARKKIRREPSNEHDQQQQLQHRNHHRTYSIS